MRQKRYIEQNRGEYMFRIDVDWVVDATMAGKKIIFNSKKNRFNKVD